MANLNYELAKELHQHGKLVEAKIYFHKALEEDPHSPIILRDFAILLIDLEEYVNAIKYLDQAIQLSEDPFCNYYRGIALYRLGNLEEAEKELLRVKDTLKGAMNVSADLGDLYYDMENFEKAIEFYKEAVEFEPFDPIILNNLALSYFQNEQIDLAIETIKKAIELNPMEAEYYDNLAMMLYEKGEVEECLKELYKATEINPTFSKAHADLSLIYYDLEKYEDAEEEIKKAIELEPENAVYHAILSNIYFKLGKYQEAQRETDTILKLIKPDENSERSN
ncbi:MAG: tetratricopeptide repeat protein [bacterium]|nr:tetratricopeptide repeat protein [bacterium]